jgi:hypothetical protein
MGQVDKQWRFLKMVALLIGYADLCGYKLTGGDLYRDERCKYGSKNSYHKKRLAIDVNLFIDGIYRQDTAAYEKLGLFWESLGGTWGGRFDKPDGNHLSYLEGRQ